MGFATVYCTKCGAQILGAELEKGSAVSRGGKYFCAECAATLPPESPGAAADKRGSTKFRKPSESGRNTDIIRNLQGMGGGSRGGTTRISQPAPDAEGSSGAVKAGIAIGAVVVLGIIGFVISQMGSSGGGSGAGATKGDPARAKQAVEAAEALRGKGDAKAFLEAAQKAKREAAGTDQESAAAALVNEANDAVKKQADAAALEAEAKALAGQARAADDPLLYDGSFRELVTKAKTVAPDSVARIQAMFDDVVQSGLMRMLGKIDMSMAGSPAGYKRVISDIADVAAKAAAAGPAGKNPGEAAAKKRKEADDKFLGGANDQLADLVKRVDQMIADLMLDEADRAVTLFISDYAGTPVEEKARPLKDKVAARRKELESAWVEPVEADWKKETGTMKVAWNGKEMSFTCDGPEGPSAQDDPDKTRRILFAKADASWRDYDVEFELNIEEHGGTLLLRTDGANPDLLNFMPQDSKGVGLPKNQWFKLTSRVFGGKVRISVGGNYMPDQNTNSSNGTFGFIGYKGSKFKIRNVRVRRLK